MINRKLKFISFLAYLSFANILAYSQVNELFVHDTDDISISQNDSNKTGVFIFVKASSPNPITNKLLLNLILLEISGDIDTTNFETYLINIISNNSSCANKCMSLNEYELPSFFNFDPYNIIIYPSKKYGVILNERIDSVFRKTISVVPNIKSKNSPFLHFKDYHLLIKLIRIPEYGKNYQALKLQYDQLQEKLLFLQKQIDTLAKLNPIIQQYLLRFNTIK